MPTITQSQIPTLRCTTQHCPHYKCNTHTIPLAKHRCTINSPHGIRILNSNYIESSNTPSFCPYASVKDKQLAQASALARKIGQKEKRLQEAQDTVNKITAELPELYEELKNMLNEIALNSKGEKDEIADR